MAVIKLNIIDGLDGAQRLNAEQHSDTSLTPYHALEYGDLPVSGTNPLPVTTSAPSISPGAPSGSLVLATAAASQSLASAGTATGGLLIGNPSTAAGQGVSTAESAFVNFTGAAATTTGGGQSHELLPGGSLSLPAGLATAVNWTAATVGHMITATVL